jgi:HEAT repeat protein
MKKSQVLWLVPALAVLACVVVSIPGTPVYLPVLMNAGDRHEGRTTRHWLKTLDSSDPEARRQAARALGAIGPPAEKAVPRLAAVMQDDPDSKARLEASLALTKMGPAVAAVVPALAQALGDPEPGVRLNALVALMRLKAEARPAVPALTRALKDPANRTNARTFTFTIQAGAATALGYATRGTPEAVPALMEALQSADTVPLRLAVVRALGDVGADAKPAVPRLRELAKDADPDMKSAAGEALYKIDGAPAAGTSDRRS